MSDTFNEVVKSSRHVDVPCVETTLNNVSLSLVKLSLDTIQWFTSFMCFVAVCCQ